MNRILAIASSLGCIVATATSVIGCGTAQADDTTDPVATHLQLFDQLDFEAYNKRNWDLFRQIHCADIVYDDSQGNHTEGIEAHIQAAQFVMSWAPDVSIVDHVIKVGQGDNTAVTAHTHLTFTAPLPLPNGTTIPPTGKSASGPAVTVATWRGNCIATEQVFMGDSAVTNKALGLSQ